MREAGEETVEAGGVFRYVVWGEIEDEDIELYGCQRTLVRVAGGARWAIEWEAVCIDLRRDEAKIETRE